MTHEELEATLNEHMQKSNDILHTLRHGLNFRTFVSTVPSSGTVHLQKQHCFVDAIHNPDSNSAITNNNEVVLTENGQVKFSRQMAPGETHPLYGMPFMTELVANCGAPVTIYGRIRE